MPSIRRPGTTPTPCPGLSRTPTLSADLVPGAVPVEPALEEVGRAGERAELSMGTREGGRFELRFSAPADVGALVEAAVSEARDALFAAGTRR